MNLKGLCKYYISCVTLENNTTLRASMKDERSFMELPWISNKILRSAEVGAFLRGNREKERELLIGYPILKTKHFLSPVFIIYVTYNDGQHGKPEGFVVDDELLINKDVIDKYSTNDKTENIYELRELEAELGFAEGHALFSDLPDKVKLLQTIRPNWEWVDELDYGNMRKGAIRPTDADGILNRTILLSLIHI